jgi:hypothetical protein
VVPLPFPHARVAASQGEQFGMRAVFRSAPRLDHEDLIGAGRGGEVVGDDDDRAAPRRRQEALDDEAQGGVAEAALSIVRLLAGPRLETITLG